MGAHKSYLVVIILSLVLIGLIVSGCAQSNEFKIKKMRPKPILNESNTFVLNETVNVNKSGENITNSSTGIVNLPEAYYDHSEFPSSTKNEITRERKFANLIDLDLLTQYNCDEILVDLDEEIIDIVDDINDFEADLADAKQDLKAAYDNFDRKYELGVERDINRASYRIEDEKEEVSEHTQNLINAQRELDELEKTRDSVDEECKRIEINKKRN